MCSQIAPVIEDIDDFPMSIKERKLKQFYSKNFQCLHLLLT